MNAITTTINQILTIGQVANVVAARHVFTDYQIGKAQNTIAEQQRASEKAGQKMQSEMEKTANKIAGAVSSAVSGAVSSAQDWVSKALGIDTEGQA